MLFRYFLSIIFVVCFIQMFGNTDHFISVKNNSWIVIDGQNIEIDSVPDYSRIGFILKLDYCSEENQVVYYSNNGYRISFSKICKSIIDRIESTETRYILVFDISEEDVAHFNREVQKMAQKLSFSTVRSNSISLLSILKDDRLILFSRQRFESLDKHIHFLDDYVREIDCDALERPGLIKIHEGQACMLYGLLRGEDQTEISSSETRHKWLNKYFGIWQYTGVQPVFLVVDSLPTSFSQFKNIANSTRNTNAISGEITLNNVPLSQVHWQGEEVCTSYGRFSFPVSSEKLLIPYLSGYSFSPESILVSPDNDNKHVSFTAKAKKIHDQLECALFFNSDEMVDSQRKITIDRNEVEIICDKKRGKVLYVPAQKFVVVGNTDALGMVDKSFSISFWIKPPKEERRIMITGSNGRMFRKGFHVELREMKPYFGFFIDDKRSETTIEPNQWTNLTFCYDHCLKQKRIYINGNLTDIEYNSHSFSGIDSLFIGKCMAEVSPVGFLLDNYLIWSRALGQEEIEEIQTERPWSAEFNDDTTPGLWNLIIVLILTGFCIVLLLLLLIKRKKNNTSVSFRTISKTENENALLLFGKPTFFNAEGKDIFVSLPPLAKEIFLKLLVSKVLYNEGVTLTELTEMFWSKLPKEKAKNSRNVALARLRKKIEEIEGLSIEYSEGKYFIELGNDVYVDYLFTQQCSSFTGNADAEQFYRCISSGRFLDEVYYEWLLEDKDKVNFEINELLLVVLRDNCNKYKDRLKQLIAEYVLKFDDLNEYALRAILLIYKKNNQHAKMNTVFHQFTSTYQKIFSEPFNQTLQEFLKNGEK